MDIIWVIFSLIGVLGLFFLLIYGLNKLNKKIGIVSGSKMRVLDRVNIGRDGMIMVVSVAGKLMLISVPDDFMKILRLSGADRFLTIRGRGNKTA